MEKRSLLFATIVQFFHCLFRFHRSVTWTIGGVLISAECECGRVFWRHPLVRDKTIQGMKEMVDGH
jgi:hypothetical protein